MRKYKDEAMELIKTVAENSHHNVAKPFERGAKSFARSPLCGSTAKLLSKQGIVK